MLVVRVTGSGLVGPMLPPESLGHSVSNFHLLSPEEMKKHGFYPYQGKPKPKFDYRSQRLSHSLILDGDTVTDEWKIVDKEPRKKSDREIFNDHLDEMITIIPGIRLSLRHYLSPEFQALGRILETKDSARVYLINTIVHLDRLQHNEIRRFMEDRWIEVTEKMKDG